MPLSWSTLGSLAGMTDEVGVLSIYVTLDPHARAESAPRAPWEVRLRKDLGKVQQQLKEQGPREHYMALGDRIERLRPDLERLLDPAAPGQGRAMFATVAGGRVRTVSLQTPLDDRVVLEPGAFIRPLLTAWSRCGPAGVVAVSADEIRMIDVRLGWTEEVAAIRPPEHIEQNELKGPAAANPALSLHSASQRDLFLRREEDKLLRFLRTVGPAVTDQARQREWDQLVVTGEAHLVNAVTEGLPPGWNGELVTLSHPVATLTVPKIVATVEQALDEARQRRRRALATRAYESAMSANAGAWGLSDTLTALQQGQVAHLLLAADGQWPGRRTPDGLFMPDGEVPPGVDADTLTPEPNLGERMIDLAFNGGARVTVLEPDDAEVIAGAGGVAALLRW